MFKNMHKTERERERERNKERKNEEKPDLKFYINKTLLKCIPIDEKPRMTHGTSDFHISSYRMRVPFLRCNRPIHDFSADGIKTPVTFLIWLTLDVRLLPNDGSSFETHMALPICFVSQNIRHRVLTCINIVRVGGFPEQQCKTYVCMYGADMFKKNYSGNAE